MFESCKFHIFQRKNRPLARMKGSSASLSRPSHLANLPMSWKPLSRGPAPAPGSPFSTPWAVEGCMKPSWQPRARSSPRASGRRVAVTPHVAHPTLSPARLGDCWTRACWARALCATEDNILLLRNASSFCHHHEAPLGLTRSYRRHPRDHLQLFGAGDLTPAGPTPALRWEL